MSPSCGKGLRRKLTTSTWNRSTERLFRKVLAWFCEIEARRQAREGVGRAEIALPPSLARRASMGVFGRKPFRIASDRFRKQSAGNAYCRFRRLAQLRRALCGIAKLICADRTISRDFPCRFDATAALFPASGPSLLCRPRDNAVEQDPWKDLAPSARAAKDGSFL